jgi:hypothetical protein
LNFMAQRRGHKGPSVPEEFRIYVADVVNKFRDGELVELKFPADLGRNERKYIHEIARKAGLKSASHGYVHHAHRCVPPFQALAMCTFDLATVWLDACALGVAAKETIAV